jgi:hypothetical protein
LQASHSHIQRRLRQTISALGRTVLDTTPLPSSAIFKGMPMIE